MTPEEIELEEAAFQFAIAHRRPLAKKIVDTEVFIPERAPLTVFMAGSPGAGKTEISKAMVEALEKGHPEAEGRRVLRIDPDDFRELIPGYSGGNSYLFQRAVTKILEKVLDRAFEKRVSFILDGTMSNLEVAKRNIDRVLRGARAAQIMYVYQRPELAWEFVKAREITEGRNIPMEKFAQQYLAVRRNIIELRQSYGQNLHIDLLVKNTDCSEEFYEEGVTVEQIDALIPETYDYQQLIELLTEADRHA
jgi:adenylate kinase family enzyme